MGKLIEQLTEYSRSKAYPFHMPGHKRNIDCKFNPYEFDITEINGFDDLGEPEEILKDLQNRVEELYGCRHAYILVNGSTSGVLAGISAVLKPGDNILMSRNSHKSAYNTAFLRQLNVEYVFPQIDDRLGISLEISSEDVEKALISNPDIKAVFVTSPTYEGIISNIKEISQIVHRYGAILIVDSAHGAHIGLNGYGINPVCEGADITIMSLHKTLPSPTQTAVICVNSDRVDAVTLKKFINIYNSSSPSYLLLAGIENCIDLIVDKGELLLREYYRNLEIFRNKCEEFRCLRLYKPKMLYDIGKILICTDKCNLNGRELAEILRRKYNIEIEMSACNYILAMTSCMDTEEAFDMLFQALKEIDSTLIETDKDVMKIEFSVQKEFEAHEIENCNIISCDIKKSLGKISGDYVYLYPPGIPWIVPGEKITSAIIDKAELYLQNGFSIRGIKDNKIQVIER